MFIITYINYKYFINNSLSKKSTLCFSLFSRTLTWIQTPKELGGIISHLPMCSYVTGGYSLFPCYAG